MRYMRLPAAAFTFLICFASLGWSGTGGNNHASAAIGNTRTGTAAADAISGRVVDSATGAAIKGNVVIALESLTDGSIVNETAPDAHGNFSFTHVAPGSYGVVIAGTSSDHKYYAPLILVSSGSTFGEGKPLAPGNHLGTMKLHVAPGAMAANVSVTADKPITAVVSAAMTYSGHTFQYPWPDSAPTFDAKAQASCGGAAACGTATVKLPAAAAFVAVYNGDSTQYIANPAGAGMDLFVSAYKQNSAETNCVQPALGPRPLNVQEGKTSQLDAFNFLGCK